MMARRLMRQRASSALGSLYMPINGLGVFRAERGADGFFRLVELPGYSQVRGPLVSADRFATRVGSSFTYQLHAQSSGLSQVLASTTTPQAATVLRDRLLHRVSSLTNAAWRARAWDGADLGPIPDLPNANFSTMPGDGTKAYLHYGNTNFAIGRRIGRSILNTNGDLPETSITISKASATSESSGVAYLVRNTGGPAEVVPLADSPAFAPHVPAGAEHLPVFTRDCRWHAIQPTFDGVDSWIVARVVEVEIRWDGLLVDGSGYMSISRRDSTVLFRINEASLELYRIMQSDSTYIPPGWRPVDTTSNAFNDFITTGPGLVVRHPDSFSHNGFNNNIYSPNTIITSNLGKIYWGEGSGTSRFFFVDANDETSPVKEFAPVPPVGVRRLLVLPREGLVILMSNGPQYETRDDGETWETRPSGIPTFPNNVIPLYPRAYPVEEEE